MAGLVFFGFLIQKYTYLQRFTVLPAFLAVFRDFRGFSRFRDFPRPKNFPVVGRNFFGFFKSKYICVQSFGCLGPLLQFLKSISNATARFWPVFGGFRGLLATPHFPGGRSHFFWITRPKIHPPAKFQHSRTFPRFKNTISTSSVSPDNQLYIYR